MRAVVTGASGFLGGRLAEVLGKRGDEVTILARKASDLRHLTAIPVRVVEGDLLDLVSLRRAVQGSTHIFHCAACSTDWAPMRTYEETNVTGTQNLLTAVQGMQGLQRFLHVSTTDVYGYPEIPCKEDGPTIETALPYNRTKLAGERAVFTAVRKSGIPVTILRPATIYGPRGKDFTVDMAMLLRQGMMACINGGSAPGGFAYVDNVVQAMLAAVESPNTVGEAYNLADGTGTTWKQYLTRFAELLGTKPPWINLPFQAAIPIAACLEAPHRYLGLRGRPLLTRHAVYLLARNQEFPIGKAQSDFGFLPEIGVEEGLRRSVEWLEASGGARSNRLHR